MSWKWVGCKARVGESLVWMASIWSLANHFLSLSLFPFPHPSLGHWFVTSGRQQSLSVPLQHKAQLCCKHTQSLRHIPNATWENPLCPWQGCVLPPCLMPAPRWRNPLENHSTLCRTGHYSEWVNVTEFLQLFTFHQHLRTYKKQKVLWEAPPGWMHTRRVHQKEPDLFCPHGTHKDSFIPCSPSIPTQNGMYWHQVNSLPTTESQCCTSSVCSKALGFYLTFMLDCMEPDQPQGEVEAEVRAAAAIRGIVHDSQIHF